MTVASSVQALAAKLKEVFEEKSNKITSWGETPSDVKYPSEKLVKSSLDTKEASSNKTASFGATPSDDKYPTEKLVKDSLDLKEDIANKVTSFGSTPSDDNYPSEKLVKDALDTKLESSDLPTKTSDLTNDGEGVSGKPFLTEHQSLDSTIVDVEKQQVADTGFSATYVVKQGGSQVGSKINIPKDFLVKSGEVKSVSAADDPVTGYVVGDKYIDFVINSKDNDATDEHMYILVSDLVEDTTYVADEDTLTLSNGEFSIKAGGVDTTEIADGAVTVTKLGTDAVETAKIKDSNVTTAKIADDAVTQDKISDDVIASWLTISNVDEEIENALDALTAAL